MVRAVLRVKKLTQNARLPTRGSPHSAGLDLYACEESSVPSLGKALVPTGLSIACPPGCYARIAPRSGLAWKNHIDVGAGVVDADYRGPVGVVLFNHSSEALQVKVGDRIAQLILEKIEYPEVVQVEDLEATERGSGGFGSTGVASNPEPDAPEQTEIEKVQDTNKRQKMESGDDAHRNDLDEAKGEMLVALESGDFSQEEKLQLKKLVVNDKERVNPIAFAFLKLKDEAVMVRDLRLLL